jgi:DNA-binding transcriptional MerR regulator
MSSAAFAYPAKSAEAFRTISEVAVELDVPQHVLRFWESRFNQVRPVKRAGGRRYYRPDDIDLLKGIRALLYSDGFTIKGVQKVLKERGLRHVAGIGRGDSVIGIPEPVVVEKIVYVEKPAAEQRIIAVKKPRPAHLRAVPDMSLPFFDLPEMPPAFGEASAGEPVMEAVPVEDAVLDYAAAEKPVTAGGVASEERERLEELLDELTGLKSRLAAARNP